MALPPYRTTPELVAAIVEVNVPDGVTLDDFLTPFIAIANEMVTDVCSNSGYSDGFVNSKMELIERWLSAHFYTILDPRTLSERVGAAAATYQAKVDFGLSSSVYGQTAMRLDTALSLARIDNSAKIERRLKVSITALGTRRGGLGWPWGWPGDDDWGWDIATTVAQ